MSEDTKQAKAHSNQVFTFGDPTPVMDQRDILNYAECWTRNGYLEPPVSPVGLSKSLRSNSQHESCIFLKCNILTSTFIPHPLLSRQAFKALALDHLVFANHYLEKIQGPTGKLLGVKHTPAKYTRKRADDERYGFIGKIGQEHNFLAGSIYHGKEADVNQEIYGVPSYLGALSSAWLNEAATLFRRKYYLNGSHAGFIMYLTDPAHDEDDITDLRQALKDSKGPGNFRNLFMYAPNGKKEGLQIIPISEVQAKDEFASIKAVTSKDVLNAHRVPPHMIGEIPQNSAGFGSAEAAQAIFAANEIKPLQNTFLEINDFIGEEVVAFDPYIIELAAPVPKA